VHDWSVNAAPKQRRTPGLLVEAGGAVSYNALPDWIDPDGDDVYLKDVEAAPATGRRLPPDGQLTPLGRQPARPQDPDPGQPCDG
jgi:hypothetical protein